MKIKFTNKALQLTLHITDFYKVCDITIWVFKKWVSNYTVPVEVCIECVNCRSFFRYGHITAIRDSFENDIFCPADGYNTAPDML